MLVLRDTLIKRSIQLIPEQSTEALAHTWKCFFSTTPKSQFRQFRPFLIAIRKELAKRSKRPIIEEDYDA